MIRQVHIENFRCIRRATIDLDPLTVLVGPNASGKSTVLSALDPNLRIGRNDVWQRRTDVHTIARVTLDNSQVAERRWNVSEPGHGPGAWNNQTFRLVHFDLNQLRSQNQLGQAPQLAATGANLVNVFATLTRKEQSAVAEELCRLTGVFADVDTVPTGNGNHTLRFQDRWKSDLWYTPADVSDGTMLLLAYLLLQRETPRVDVIGVEEPDRGLHPYLLGQLIAFMRSMTTATNPVQFILATHSAELLDQVAPREVRFLTRDRTDGTVKVDKIDPGAEGWEDAFREYRQSLGSVWLSGSVGGVPGE